MPTLTRWSIKSAMLYLIAAMAIALVLAAGRLWPLPGWVGRLNPVYFHLFMVGWVAQLIFGIVYWMFPIITRQRPRGSERLGWAAFLCLNAGLLLRAIFEPAVFGSEAAAGWGWVLAVSAALQWLAGLFFVINSWPRVRDRYRGE